MARGALLAAFALCFATSAHAVMGRDDQWTYVPASADHGARAELRGDYPEGVPSVLIFQIECLASERILVFRYLTSDDVPNEPIALIVQETSQDDDVLIFSMPTSRVSSTILEGRLQLTSEIATSVRTGFYFMIGAPVAPDDMDEAWHAGDAPALRRLTRECSERPVG